MSDVFKESGYAVLQPGSSVSNQMNYALAVQPASAAKQTLHALASTHSAILDTNLYAIVLTFFPPYFDLDIEKPFVERTFPSCLSYGSSGGPGFKTTVFQVDSGLTTANPEWDRLRARYSLDLEDRSIEDMDEFQNFFYAMRGQAIGFRFKDWNDYQITKQNILVGDGQTKTFQIFKRYQSGSHIFDRIITKPVLGSVEGIKIQGVEQTDVIDFNINYTTGTIDFETAPGSGEVGTVDYLEFDVPVRFATDEITVEYEDFNSLNCTGIDLIEVLV